MLYSGTLISNVCSSPNRNVDSPQTSTLCINGNSVNPYSTTGVVSGRSGSAVFDSVSTPPKYGAYLQAPGVNSRIGDRSTSISSQFSPQQSPQVLSVISKPLVVPLKLQELLQHTPRTSQQSLTPLIHASSTEASVTSPTTICLTSTPAVCTHISLPSIVDNGSDSDQSPVVSANGIAAFATRVSGVSTAPPEDKTMPISTPLNWPSIIADAKTSIAITTIDKLTTDVSLINSEDCSFLDVTLTDGLNLQQRHRFSFGDDEPLAAVVISQIVVPQQVLQQSSQHAVQKVATAFGILKM